MGISNMSNDDARYHCDMLLVASRPLKPRKQPSRFKRLAIPEDQVPQSFRVTERVLAILVALAAHRFLSTDQIARLDGGSAAYVRHLLRLLHRHGLVDRPAGQAAYLSSFLHQGNVSLVYSITRKGMRLLAEHRAPVDPRLDWTTKNTGTGSALFLAHALQVSELMLALRLAMPADNSLRLIDHNDLLPSFPDATRARKFPYSLVVSIQQDLKPMTLTVIPDRLCAIRGADGWGCYLALEIDRGTESLSARSKKITAKATWRRKVAGYYAAFRQAKFAETWGFQGLRVLTITTSDARIDHMLALQRDITNDTAAGLFLYSTWQRIAEHGVLGPACRSSSDDHISLVRT